MRADVQLLARLLRSGEYRAVIDRRYPLEEVVEATHYVEAGEKIGNVVLIVADARPSSRATDRPGGGQST